MIGCTCSEYQLEQVGCICERVTVHVWPRGYASDEGMKSFVMNASLHAQYETVKAFGPCAAVAHISKTRPSVLPVSAAAAAAYTRNDNS